MGYSDFGGMYSAIFSVYDEDRNVMAHSVRELMDYQRAGGLDGFYVGGNTGECTILPNRTRMQMLETVMAHKGTSRIIAHIGAGHFDDTEELVRHADKLGVDAIASLPPSLTAYYKNQEITDYYRRLAQMTDKPLIAYITGVFRGDVVSFAEELSEIPNFAGLKLSIPDYYAFQRLRAFREDMLIFNGPDETMLCGLTMGADGAIGTSYNILPKEAKDAYTAFCRGDLTEARRNQKKLNHLITHAIGGSGLQYWKAYMTVLGFDMGHTAFPAKPVTEGQLEAIRENLRQVRELV